MGTELEWKLSVPEPSLLDHILADEAIRSRMTETPRRYHMQTSYYDTSDRRFSARRITLRRRLENNVSVLCVKAPLTDAADPHAHGEWELEGDDLPAALPRFAALGAPTAVSEPCSLLCLWRADFIRRAVMLRMDDGSLCELALDCGSLYGPTRSCPFCELELELKHGAPDASRAFCEAVRERFGLSVQTQSKFARARALE